MPSSPRTGSLAIADDSGIEIDALDGRPGIHSARWTEESDWIPRVLRELEARPDRPRTGRYVAAAAIVWPEGREQVVRGTVEGVIADAPRGDGGFGYDPIFVPDDGDGRTFAEMRPEDKHALSHRGRAFRALVPLLDRALTGPCRAGTTAQDWQAGQWKEFRLAISVWWTGPSQVRHRSCL